MTMYSFSTEKEQHSSWTDSDICRSMILARRRDIRPNKFGWREDIIQNRRWVCLSSRTTLSNYTNYHSCIITSTRFSCYTIIISEYHQMPFKTANFQTGFLRARTMKWRAVGTSLWTGQSQFQFLS